jgi:tetratricopeptide (TPR) repeat protein
VTLPCVESDPVSAQAGGTDEYLAGHARYYAKDFEGAAYHLARAVAERGDNPDAYYLLARAQWRRGDLKSALGAFQNVVRLQPRCAPALADLSGLLLEELGNVPAAEKFSRRALEADPLCAPAHVILGNVLRSRGDEGGAAACYREAVGINPGLPDPIVNLGVLSLEAGDFKEAMALFERGLSIDPSHPNALWNRGNLLLLLGRLTEGWPGYEQRFHVRGRNASHPDPARAAVAWDGSSFSGKTLLVYAEQGLGDTIQFARYLPLVAELGGDVIFECQNDLLALLGRNLPGIRMVPQRSAPQSNEGLDFDAAIPLLSLPGIFRTKEETIPSRAPYISPDPALSAAFGGRFDSGRYNVGITWAGNPAHPNDRNRSCPPEAFGSVAAIPGIQMFSLQKDPPPGSGHIAGAADIAGSLSDFSATASFLDHLDLIVTVDTSVAHLAGAMGKPVWLLLPFVPDWRWQLGREDSPWYPTMRLFRQSRPGDWSGVMKRVEEALGAASLMKPRVSGGTVPAAQSPADALFSLGTGRFDAGDMDGALLSFREALASDGAHAESHNALGVVLARLGEPGPALEEIGEAIALEPGNAEYHYNLGNVLNQAGRSGEASASYRKALALAPGFLQAHVNLGCVLNELGDPEGALDEYTSALAQEPTSVDLLKHVASLCMVLHDEEGALRAYERAARGDPYDADVWHRVGSLRQSKGDIDEAIRCYRKALDLNPGMAETWGQLGGALVMKGLPGEAYRALENALRIRPDFPEVLNNLGLVLKGRGQVDIAEKCFRMAIRSRGDYVPAFNNLGTVYLESSRFAEAEAQFREAVRLEPDFPLAWNNLGNALAGLGSFHEAKQIYRAVIGRDPALPEVHFNLAAALQHEHRFTESIRSYDDALRLRPEYAEARLNRALVLLLRGEFVEGWRDYECRFSVKDPRRMYVPPGPEHLKWDGKNPEGKTILVRPEQGFGDTIQFARYIPMLAELGARVLFECPKELCGLFRNFPGIDTLIEFRAEPPSLPFDRYVQLLSLPGLMGTDSVESIPWRGPYIQADRALAESVRDRFDDGLCHVGIVWGGNPVHRNDFNRSCALNEFLPLLDIPGVRFFSLQKGKPAFQIEALPPEVRPENLEPLLGDFSMTAALLSHIDLLIAVDTSVAHLAGAMGRPVWTLLPFRPDWRWLLDRQDSPWYPGMRLFRQPSHGDWSGVIRDVRTGLVSFAGH